MDPVSDGDDLPGSDVNGSGPDGNAAEGAYAHGYGGSNGSATNGNGSTGGVLATLENRPPSVPSLQWAYGPPAKPEILSAKPTPTELTHAVRRRWGLALCLGLATGISVAAIVWFVMPIKYEAFSLLRVSNRAPSVLNESYTAVEEFNIFKRTQVQLIQSPLVLLGTLREKDINQLKLVRENPDDPVAWLKDQLIIDYPDDSEILRVAMKGTSPSEIKKIVDKVVDTYLKEIVQREREVRLANEEKLDRALQTQLAELGTRREALHKAEAAERTAAAEGTVLAKKLAMDQLHDFLAQRSRITAAMAELDMKIHAAEAREQGGEEFQPPEYMVQKELNMDPEINKLSGQLAELNQAMSAAREKTKKPQSSPQVQRLKKALQKVEESLEERKAMLRPQIEEMIRDNIENRGGPAQSLDRLQAQKVFLTAKLEEVAESLLKQSENLEKLEGYSARVSGKQEDVRALEKITAEMRARLDRMKVEKDAQERIVLTDKATLKSGSGNAIQKYVAVAFSGLLAMAGTVLAVAFLEFQKRKINAVHEVNDGLGIRVIGELPNVSGRTWRRIRGGQGGSLLKALMAERIDGTRTALIHTTLIDPPRVVMVTSAEPHEGKTTTATQLAASLARSGRRTLLVDADIRNPGAHRVFDMPSEPGLCELLRGEAERDAVVHPTRTANLWLLPAGRCDLRSVQALSTSYLGTAIAALCVQFDYIIIDSGPVLKVADPLMVGQHVDAAIVSVLKDVSKVPKVYEACERLRSVGITVMGSVVNGVNDDAARHGVELLMAETGHAPATAAAGSENPTS